MPREPPTTSTWPAVYLLSPGERRGTSAEDLRRDEAVLGLRRLEADVGDGDLAGVEAARRDGEADLGAVHRDGDVGAHGRAGDLAGRRVHARRDVDRDDRDAGRR